MELVRRASAVFLLLAVGGRLGSGGAQGEPLLSLELTVDGEPSMLVLNEGQAYVDAARETCRRTDNAVATDNCVSGAIALIVSQHLRKKDAVGQLASPGLALVREALQDYDPAGFVGTSPLHVDIELPIQTKRTVCDDAKCWELGADDGFEPTNHTLQVPAWASNTTETANEVARMLELWRAQDMELLERRVALERTRKATPIDLRLHRGSKELPVASFDGFYPPYFVLHTESLFFDAQRLKVAGDFRPPTDGDVCISVVTLRDGVEPPEGAAAEACFAESYNAVLEGFASAAGTHKLTVRLRRPDGTTAGEGDVSTFTAAPPLKPGTLKNDAGSSGNDDAGAGPAGGGGGVASKFIQLLRNAVVGWLYMENAGEDPGVAGPLSSGWSGVL